ncbi:MAG TPA: acetate/propionate family kinase [Burkholderiaceae bacterium]|nr:acetate/propionate family kinase [Burkholderiaceae bacterium]
MAGESSLLLVLNCGSSSIKYALFETHEGRIPRQSQWSGKVEEIGSPSPTHQVSGQVAEAITLDPQRPYFSALDVIRATVQTRLHGRALDAVVHRVVHGGAKYFQPVHIDADVLADLRSYIPLAPLHQPFALEAVDALLASNPAIPQFACFDTAFHRSLPQVEQLLPLPWEHWEQGMRRYGFHGLSYEYIAHVLKERVGEAARGRVIVAHLGNGASLCGMQDLRSAATTMGFSTLEGLMMGTRCGSVDPGAILHLMEIKGIPLAEVGQMLTREAGLLGVSGLSSDTRVLLEHEQDNARAKAALDLYIRTIVREIGALTALLGGLDMLVFTAGVGENNPVIRGRVCRRLGFLGVALDDAANSQNASVVSSTNSKVVVRVEPTNEEWIAANHAWQLLRSQRAG